MMRISKSGLDLIKQFEGYRRYSYIDIAGVLTIGYGHVVRSKENWNEGISRASAEELLKQDILSSERAVSRLIYVKLLQKQFDALVSFTYNVGSGALQRSTLRQKLNRGDYFSVPEELLRWVFAGGKKSRGLLRRRIKEAELYMT
ncbi:lysozyme [Rickettsia endosymbiont of Cardiosporidium cionae]|uniref:lysozyme n=1 Tax=Rickettsia endosymbiont of Cardiosporidium cionae TaxID=2777155 RepID=UPI00189329B5|nr:lysozyme [Rickettsia endosymbiont of Cardiosporidium cionae]KAF8818092.1 lysozyme [Rickettsia endosymbiont of Cardiosporidium cionae]